MDLCRLLGSATMDIEHSHEWDDPLPHSFSPVKHYLSYPSREHTKAAVILMHGRGDNADDMVDVFLPTLRKRYRGKESTLDDEEDRGKDLGPLAVVGLEAQDNVWYPNSHNATEKVMTDQSEPYQYAALSKIRDVILELHNNFGLPLDNIVFAGFSQGAILGNTYLLAGMKQLLSEEGGQGMDGIPLPGYMLALAGSLFKTPPRFPLRGYTSDEHRDNVHTAAPASASVGQPKRVVNRLLCGLADRYFPEEEISQAATELHSHAQQLASRLPVTVSVGMKPGQGHIITPRMVAAVVQSLDDLLEHV